MLDATIPELAIAPLVTILVSVIKGQLTGAPKWALPLAALALALGGQAVIGGVLGDGVDPALGVVLWLSAIGIHEGLDQGAKALKGQSKPIAKE